MCVRSVGLTVAAATWVSISTLTHHPSLSFLSLRRHISVCVFPSEITQVQLHDVRTFQHAETVDTHTHHPNPKKLEKHTPFALTLTLCLLFCFFFFPTFSRPEVRPPLIGSHAHLFHEDIVPVLKKKKHTSLYAGLVPWGSNTHTERTYMRSHTFRYVAVCHS